jgi:hypothetical protein
MAGYRSTVNVPFQRAFDPSANLDAAGKLFMGIADRIDTRAKNKAINELLATTPDATQSPVAFNQQQRQAFAGIRDIDPLQALNLANAQTAPYYKQQARADALQQQEINTAYKDTALGETIRHNQAMESKVAPKGFGAITDEFGTTYIYNKDTGKYEPIVNANASTGGVSPKNIQIVDVVSRDGSGNETTKKVPVNKLTGNIVVDGRDSGEKASSFKRPTPSQQDRDSALAGKKGMDNIANIKQLYAPDIVGPIDNAFAWVANATGTAQSGGDAERNYKLNQEVQNLKANLTSALIKGVPSDRDLAMIEDMLPSTSDSEAVFNAKLKRIEDILSRQQKMTEEQMRPRGQSEMYKLDTHTTDSNTTTTNGGTKYGKDTEIIRF